MNEKNIRLQFCLFEGTKTEQGDGELFQKSGFNDIGSNKCYFFTSTEKHQNLKNITALCKPFLSGSYLLMEIVSSSQLHLYIGLNVHQLSEKIGYASELSESIPRILVRWENASSGFTSRYLSFQQEYDKTSCKGLLLKSYFFQFLYHFITELETATLDDENFKLKELQKIREIEEAVTQSFHKPTPPVKEMARMAGMSISKFKILFEELFGQSPHQHILHKKMIYANELLQTGHYSITQVAYKIGYNHPSGFIRIYRNKFNHSPKPILQ